MAVTYTLIPLHTRPDLIPACVKILRREWPHCKAELLAEIESEKCSAVPCSLGLVEQRGDTAVKDSLCGHVRCVPVTSRPRAVFLEGLCVDASRRGKGLGKIVLARVEELLGKLGYSEVHLHADIGAKGFYLRHGYRMHTLLVHTTGANLLRTFGVAVSWHGNVPSPGWEAEYDGHVATEKEVADGILGYFFVKYLYEVTFQD